jgi:hypothetical protein
MSTQAMRSGQREQVDGLLSSENALAVQTAQWTSFSLPCLNRRRLRWPGFL